MCTRIVTRVPPYQYFPKTDHKMCQHNISLNYHLAIPEITPEDSIIPRALPSRTRWSRDRFSRWLNYLKVNSSRPEQNKCNNWPPLSSPTFVGSIMPPAHPCFKRATTHIPMWTVTQISRNHFSNQEHNPSRYEKISTCKSCGYRNLHKSHQL